MTYNSVTAIIRDAAGQAFAQGALYPTGFFINAAGKNYTQRQVDMSAAMNKTYPQCGLFYLKKRTDIRSRNVVWECFVVFLAQDNVGSAISSDVDSSSGAIPTVESLVDDMEVLAQVFIDKLDIYGGLEVSAIEGTPEIRTLATTLSGWGMKFNINSKLVC